MSENNTDRIFALIVAAMSFGYDFRDEHAGEMTDPENIKAFLDEHSVFAELLHETINTKKDRVIPSLSAMQSAEDAPQPETPQPQVTESVSEKVTEAPVEEAPAETETELDSADEPDGTEADEQVKPEKSTEPTVTTNEPAKEEASEQTAPAEEPAEPQTEEAEQEPAEAKEPAAEPAGSEDKANDTTDQADGEPDMDDFDAFLDKVSRDIERQLSDIANVPEDDNIPFLFGASKNGEEKHDAEAGKADAEPQAEAEEAKPAEEPEKAEPEPVNEPEVTSKPELEAAGDTEPATEAEPVSEPEPASAEQAEPVHETPAVEEKPVSDAPAERDTEPKSDPESDVLILHKTTVNDISRAIYGNHAVTPDMSLEEKERLVEQHNALQARQLEEMRRSALNNPNAARTAVSKPAEAPKEETPVKEEAPVFTIPKQHYAVDTITYHEKGQKTMMDRMLGGILAYDKHIKALRDKGHRVEFTNHMFLFVHDEAAFAAILRVCSPNGDTLGYLYTAYTLDSTSRRLDRREDLIKNAPPLDMIQTLAMDCTQAQLDEAMDSFRSLTDTMLRMGGLNSRTRDAYIRRLVTCEAWCVDPNLRKVYEWFRENF